jgi:hypothetical protein
MHRTVILIVSLWITIIISSVYAVIYCFPTCDAGTHSVAWYLANPDALGPTVSACRADPTNSVEIPDCQNAEKAEAEQHPADAQENPLVVNLN